ncbi:hypothetical protein Clacol_007131 [Clathrus columnatus]|uniref:Chromo domain-containing protein n=1 Tax=Clathrus columnatus TaxID=1419009 RepID=A0AAV5AF47_9AGAM|nr:hypothetical protein Clacol_007131 [Clathrus columnatus]
MSFSPPGTQVHASQDFWEVEKILKETAHRYLVKWVGIDPETRKPWPDSWVAKEDCTKELIAEWKKKQKDKRWKSKSKKDNSAFRRSGSRKAVTSNPHSASGKSSRADTPFRASISLSPRAPTPSVQIPRLEKRKQRFSDTDTAGSDSDQEEQPQKRRKKESDNQGPSTIKVGPPGRAINYVLKHGSSEPIVTYKKVRTTKRTLVKASERDSSSRGSSARRIQSDKDSEEEEEKEEEDARVTPDVAFRSSPSKDRLSPGTEIIEETQPNDSSSSQSSPPPTTKHTRNDKNRPVSKQDSTRNKALPVIPSPIESQRSTPSPIQTFSSSHNNNPKRPKEADDVENDKVKMHRQESDPKLFEKQEEEESLPYLQENVEEETAYTSPKKPSTTVSMPPRREVNELFGDIYKSKSSKSALISVFARLGKVFGAVESDGIESPSSRVETGKKRAPSLVDEPHILSSEKHEDDTQEIDEIRDSGDPFIQNAEVDELEADVDELGPEDAADNTTATSIPESQNNRINSSMLVNATTTQRTLQPVIESPVRQLDSALGLLHRKSEEIQMLCDQVTQLKEDVARSQVRIVELEKELGRSEERREAQDLQVAQLQNELVSAKSEAAINAVQTALNPQDPNLSMVEDSAVTGGKDEDVTESSQLDPTLIQLQEETERHKSKIAQLDRDNDLLRTLYVQASNSHMKNLGELKEVKRDNISLREQATSGVRQANLFWKTQVATLETRLKQAKGEIQLLIQQNRATQDIRSRAALLPMAQKEMANVKNELDEWKDGFAKLGMENTNLRLELKRRDDEDLVRRRKEREVDEQNKRALEIDGDQYLWICPWRDDKYGKCGVLLDSREALREHFTQAGHV